MNYLFKGMNGLDKINHELIYFAARRSMSIETNFDIMLPMLRKKATHEQPIEDAVIIHPEGEENYQRYAA
jgi:hypothetical protein